MSLLKHAGFAGTQVPACALSRITGELPAWYAGEGFGHERPDEEARGSSEDGRDPRSPHPGWRWLSREKVLRAALDFVDAGWRDALRHLATKIRGMIRRLLTRAPGDR